MIDGPTCPECGGHVSTEDGLGYVCDDCSREYDNANLFLPRPARRPAVESTGVS